MKSQRRHELQQNTLEIELVRIGTFLRERATYLAWGALAAAVILFVVVYLYKDSRNKVRQQQTDFDRYSQAWGRQDVNPNQVINGFMALSQQTKNTHVAAMAALKLGDIFASQRALGTGAEEDLAQQASQAQQFYRKAMDYGDQRVIAARAHFGLARLSETLGEFDQAKAEYEAVVQANLPGEPVTALAEANLKGLGEIARPVRMATSAPASQPASGPATMPSPEEVLNTLLQPAANAPATGPSTASPAEIGK